MSDTKHYITWKLIDQAITELVSQVNWSGKEPDSIVALSRGGLIPATLLANRLGVRKIYSHGYYSYDKESRTSSLMYQDVCKSDYMGRNVLVVDDLCDLGDTLKTLTRRFEQYKPETTVKTATLFVKPQSEFIPDYTYETLKTNDWIVFPWEEDGLQWQ